MNRLFRICSRGFLLLIMALAFAGPVQAQQKFTVGILLDGQTTGYTAIQGVFISEILALTDGEFDVSFPQEHRYDGQWSAQKILDSFDALQADENVDIVLTLGIVSSVVAARSKNLQKPTFAPLILDATLLALPRSGDSTGIKNLNYLAGEIQIKSDMETFHNVADVEHLGVIIDQILFDALPEPGVYGRRWAEELGMTLDFIISGSGEDDVISKIPAHIDGVMIAPVPQLNDQGRANLIAGLIAKKIPSYSLLGTTSVEQGLLATSDPDSDWRRLARKNALNVQAVMLGEEAGDLSVSFKKKRQLTINMETARAIGVYPRYDVMSSAVLLNDDSYVSDVKWSLSEVAHEAVLSNLQLRASVAGVNAGGEFVEQARSVLRPQVGSSVGLTQLNDDSVSVDAGAVAERTTDAAVGASQIIYSESALAEVSVQDSLQQAREATHRGLELDIIQEATVTFLNILKAQTLVEIRKSSLELSRANLDLARNRVEIGSVTAADVYRWESEVATARQTLLDARAELEQSRDALNLLLDRPISERFETIPATLDDRALLVSRQELLDFIDNRRSYDLMGEMMIISGISNSPEIIGLQHQIDATRRGLLSDERAYWSPDINLTGQLGYIIDEDPVLAPSREGETDWQVGVTLSLPLFEGGARRSRISQSQFELQQLVAQKDLAQESVELLVRQNLHAISSSYPSIELTSEASIAANRNLDLVQENYAAGTVSIIELLDARDTALLADLDATNAVYDFLIDLMNLQRSTAEYDFFLDPVQMDESVERIKNYIISRG